MSLKISLRLLLVTSLFVMPAAHAVELSKVVAESIVKLGLSVEDARETPAAGLYELQAGTQIFYITDDGKHLLTGNLLDIDSKENLTDSRMKGIRTEALDTIKKDKMITYKAKDQKHEVTIFTDIDCGYCRKLHTQIADYNKLGITINYLFFPRSGIKSSAYNKAVAVWCSQDRNQALTDAKAGKSVPRATCSNPVARHYKLGTDLEIGGTPYIFTGLGNVLPGYVPPTKLKLELDKAVAASVKPGNKQVSKRN